MLDASEKQVADWQSFNWYSSNVTSYKLFCILDSSHGHTDMPDHIDDLTRAELRIALALIATAPTSALKESFEGLQ